MKPDHDQTGSIYATVRNVLRTENIRRDRREKHFTREISVIDVRLTEAQELLATPTVVARFYQTAAVTTCVVWIRVPRYSELYSHSPEGRASGRAGGGGYHKPSAALNDALVHAGINLDPPIDGHGDMAMLEALRATAVAVGADQFIIHESHA